MDFNADLSTFITGFLDELMLSYTFISSSSQVSDPEPKGPLDFYKHSMMFILFCIIVDHLCFFLSFVCHAFVSVHCCVEITCWERADLLALVCDVLL